MGLLGRALTDWAGVGSLKVYGVRCTKQTWPGEILSSRIVVIGKEETKEGRLVSADVALVNQDGEVKLAGSATVMAG